MLYGASLLSNISRVDPIFEDVEVAHVEAGAYLKDSSRFLASVAPMSRVRLPYSCFGQVMQVR